MLKVERVHEGLQPHTILPELPKIHLIGFPPEGSGVARIQLCMVFFPSVPKLHATKTSPERGERILAGPFAQESDIKLPSVVVRLHGP